MPKVLLGDVARERKETCKGSKSGFPIVGLEHLTPEEITLTFWSEASDNTFTKMFHKGDVLFGRRRAYLKKAAVAPFDGICSGDITVIEADPERIIPELLPFIIQNDDLFNFAVGKSAGSLSPRVKWEHLKNYEFELPEMKKQRELAKLLWSMDATKKSYQELISATDKLVKSQFVEMFGDLSKNNKGWQLQPLSEILLIERGGSPRPIEKYITDADDGVNWIKIGDADEGSIYITHTKEKITREGSSKSRYVQPGDFLLSNSMSFGRPYILMIDGYIHDGWLVLRDRLQRYEKLFLYALLSSDYADMSFRTMAAGSVVKNLNKDLVGKLLVPVPPMELQRQYAAFIEQSDRSKLELEQALTELNATYRSIIAKNLGKQEEE